MIVGNYADCAMNSSLKGKNLCKFIYNFLIGNLFFPHYLLVTFSNLPRIFLFTFPPGAVKNSWLSVRTDAGTRGHGDAEKETIETQRY